MIQNTKNFCLHIFVLLPFKKHKIQKSESLNRSVTNLHMFLKNLLSSYKWKVKMNLWEGFLFV